MDLHSLDNLGHSPDLLHHLTTTDHAIHPTNSMTLHDHLSETSLADRTLVHSVSRTACMTPEPQRLEPDQHQDSLWQVLIDLGRVVLEAKKDHQLLAAEIEDLMAVLENHCELLGIDPANVTHLLVLPGLAAITLTTRQALYRACDDLYQDVVRRKDLVERWISRIYTISENIHEPPEPSLESGMAPMSRGRILELERTYRKLEKEWMERLQRFQTMVGLLRVRWEQCAYLPTDDYDIALNKLFELAELQRTSVEASYLRIERPLCLSKACLASLQQKLVDLDHNYYTRQSRVRTMENVLRLIYLDLETPEANQVVIRSEATVKYAAELGRELKSLQLELGARKMYLAGECWATLAAVWDSCFVSEQERRNFKLFIEQKDVTYVAKMDRIQFEVENCRARFSKSGAVYRLMMARSQHIEKMIAFEKTAKDPKRLFQSSFQLVEEEKFRRRAYPTLLKLEQTLMDNIQRFEEEQNERFMYEGVPYLETLQVEIERRHVNETVFAKFTPTIAAPTRSQTIQIMGRPISPLGAASHPSAPRPTPNARHSMSSVRSLESQRRSSTMPPHVELVTAANLEAHLEKQEKSKPHRRPTNAHQRDASSTSSVGSNHSVRSKSSISSHSAANSPLTDLGSGVGSSSYFGQGSMATTSSHQSSSPQLTPIFNPDQTHASLVGKHSKPPRFERMSLPATFKTPPGSPISTGSTLTRPRLQPSPGSRFG